MEVYPTKKSQVMSGHRGPVYCVRWNPSGGYAISGGDDMCVNLWNPTTGKLIRPFRGHGHEVLGIDVSSDSSKMATCGGDKQPFLWDVMSGAVIRKFRGHEHKVNGIAMCENDTVMVTGSYDRSVCVWDCKSRSIDPIQSMADSKDSVSAVAVDPPFIFASSIDGTVRCYDVRKGSLLCDFIGVPVTSVALSHDHNCVLVGTLDNAVRLLDRRRGEVLNEFRGHRSSQYKVECCLTYSDAHVVCGSEDGSVFVWDLVNAKEVSRLAGHSSAVCSVSCNPRDHSLLSGGSDGSVILWK